MKRRILSLFLALALLSALLPAAALTASAETYSGTCGANLTWTLDTNTGLLEISGTGDMADYSSYIIQTDGTTITSAPWGIYYKLIKSASIGSGVTSIGSSVFCACTGMTAINVAEDNPVFCSVDGVLYSKDKTELILFPLGKAGAFTIPDGVTTIGKQAFEGCIKITSIAFPATLTSFGDWAFDKCSALTDFIVDENNTVYSSVDGVLFSKDKTDLIRCPAGRSGEYTIPGSVKSIIKNAFSDCAKLSEVVIPNSVKSIGRYAFYECSGLKRVTIPGSVTSIGSYAFYKCSELTGISIPGSVEDIEQYTFYECTGLRYALIGEGVKSIQFFAFSYCNSLRDITIPDSVTSIYSHAFFVCPALSSVTIPDGVKNLVVQAFSHCLQLRSVILPASLTDIGPDVFEDCGSLTDVFYAGTQADWDAITIGELNECLTGAKLHCSVITGNCGSALNWALDADTGDLIVTGIGTMTTHPWSSYGASIRSVIIGSGVSSISNDAFSGCTALTDVYYYGTNAKWDILSIGTGNECLTGANIHFLPLGGTCGADGDGSNLAWALDPESGVLEITGTGAMKHYDSGAWTVPWYHYKDAIKSVRIGNGVTNIGACAFSDCFKLLNVTVPATITSIGHDAFWDCRALTAINVAAGNSSFYSEDGVIYSKDKTELILYPAGKIGAFTIPDGVIEIGDNSFRACAGLTSVTIPDSVKNIGYSAFFDCTALTSIVIPDGLISIGREAFSNTGYYNDEANWIDDVLYIGNYLIAARSALAGEYEVRPGTQMIIYGAFSGCAELTAVTIPSSLTHLDGSAFSGCPNLAEITVDSENTVYSSADGVLYNKAKTSIICYPKGRTGTYTIPASVTSIGACAFQDCLGLTSITIPNSVTSIGDYAFYGCTALTSVTIDTSIYNDNWGLFYGCNALTSVTLGRNVNRFSSDMFSDCPALTEFNVDAENADYCSVDGVLYNKSKTSLICCPAGKAGVFVIPDGVTSIGDHAFYGCTGLTSFTIPDSVTSIGQNAFNNTGYFNDASNWTDGVLYIGKYLVASSYGIAGDCVIKEGTILIADSAFNVWNSSLTSVTIPDSVTSIGNYAFNGCAALTSVTIGSGVTSIGEDAFSRCAGLTSVIVDGNNTAYDSRDNCNAIIETASNTLIVGCSNTIIPDSVTSIGDYAFYGCIGLTSVTIPDSVTSIGHYAFGNCTGLTSVTLPDGVTSIDYMAFYRCTALTSVTVPDSATSIGYMAFADCTGLTSITLPDTELVISYMAFYNTGYFNDESNWMDGVLYIGNHLVKAEFSITGAYAIEPGTRTIACSAFYGCAGLTSVTIPNSVTSIDAEAFYDCTGMTDVTIPDTVTGIGDGAFGYYYDYEKEQYAKVDGFTIYGYQGSAAQVYAEENGFIFADLETMPCQHEHAHPEHKDATCIEDGYDRMICDDCGEVVSETVLPALGHNFVDGVCTRCGEKDPDYQPTETEAPGDLNGDGDVDTVDAIRLAKYLVGLTELTDEQIKAADVNGDGDVTALDGIRLAKFLVGLVETLRPEPAKAATR